MPPLPNVADSSDFAGAVRSRSPRDCDQLMQSDSCAGDHAVAVEIAANAVDADMKPVAAPHPTRAAAKIQFLDGIRGAAALLVICHHSGYLGHQNVGGLAVHMFFVLSSFLLTMIVDKKLGALAKQGASPRRWAYALLDYGARRILRVYPLFACCVVMISFGSDAHKKQWYHVNRHGENFDVLKTLSFMDGYRFFVFWTLPLELQYYLVIPVFAIVAIALRRWWWVPVLPLSYWVVYTGLYELRRSSMGLWPHLPTFVCGSIAAIVYNRIDAWIKTRPTVFTFRWWHHVAIRGIELVALVLLVSVCFDAWVFDWFGPYPFPVKNSDHFVCVYIAVLIVCEMLLPGPFSSVFEWSLLRYAGKVSFSMYLLHPRIVYSDFLIGQKNYYTKYFTMWVLVFFWSTVSYHAIEYPCQWLAQYIGKKIKALDAQEQAKNNSRYSCFCKKKMETPTANNCQVLSPPVVFVDSHEPSRAA